MAEYTKGEWKQGSLGDEPFARSCLSIYREDGRKIAEINREGFISMEECEANTRLISAAPTMYEALKAVLTCLESIIPSDLVAKSAKTSALKVIIKALAKAEGKEV